jgi:hypothetical protein
LARVEMQRHGAVGSSGVEIRPQLPGFRGSATSEPHIRQRARPREAFRHRALDYFATHHDPSTYTEDGLLGWKWCDDVAFSLNRTKGASCVRRRAVTQRIQKLREALGEAEIHPLLVVTSRSKDVRFALRRRVRINDGR